MITRADYARYFAGFPDAIERKVQQVLGGHVALLGPARYCPDGRPVWLASARAVNGQRLRPSPLAPVLYAVVVADTEPEHEEPELHVLAWYSSVVVAEMDVERMLSAEVQA